MATVSFYEPYFLDTIFNFNFSLYNQFRQYQDFQQGTVGGSLTWGYPLIAPELVASVTYTLENNSVETGTSNSLLGTTIPLTDFRQLPLYNLYNNGVTSGLRPALTYDTRDNRILPMNGIYLRASTELSLSEFGVTTEFWQNRFTGRFYHHLGGNVVLKLNTEFGVITSPSENGVPVFLRYFIGGILDLRGFAYRNVGTHPTALDHSTTTARQHLAARDWVATCNSTTTWSWSFRCSRGWAARRDLHRRRQHVELGSKYCSLSTGTGYRETNPCGSGALSDGDNPACVRVTVSACGGIPYGSVALRMGYSFLPPALRRQVGFATVYDRQLLLTEAVRAFGVSNATTQAFCIELMLAPNPVKPRVYYLV